MPQQEDVAVAARNALPSIDHTRGDHHHDNPTQELPSDFALRSSRRPTSWQPTNNINKK
jgi:hypothetical protein